METVTDMKSETLDKLADLVRFNVDSAKGFAQAADSIEDESLAAMFRATGDERERFAAELSGLLALNAEEADEDGSVKGRLHRWWLSARGALNGGDAYPILIEAERGEDSIKECYEEVIVETTGNPVNDVLHRQYAAVKAAHDRIRDLRDSYKD